MRYGLALVWACAQAGTRYVDLTGEPLFVRECIDHLAEFTTESGAKIVNSCGYDSIPSDLSVYQLHRRVATDGAGELTDTTLVASLKVGMSGGTVRHCTRDARSCRCRSRHDRAVAPALAEPTSARSCSTAHDEMIARPPPRRPHPGLEGGRLAAPRRIGSPDGSSYL